MLVKNKKVCIFVLYERACVWVIFPAPKSVAFVYSAGIKEGGGAGRVRRWRAIKSALGVVNVCAVV